MPSDEENVRYLYLVLTNGGTPTIDWASISKALNLSNGAVTKRWSRLRQAIDQDKNPGPSAYEFLWLCVKHSARDKAMDWNDIAKKCNTTAGAASKRYSRMKQIFENGDTPKSTPAKSKTITANGNDTDSPGAPDATPIPKRKRAPANVSAKKKGTKDSGTYKPDSEEDDDGEYPGKKAKRGKGAAGGGNKATKPRATQKPASKANQPSTKQHPSTAANTSLLVAPNVNDHLGHLPTPTVSGSINPTEATTLIKTEPDAQASGIFPANGGEWSSEDQFFDANEYVGVEEEAVTQESEYPADAERCETCECRAKWVANQIGVGLHEWLKEIDDEI